MRTIIRISTLVVIVFAAACGGSSDTGGPSSAQVAKNATPQAAFEAARAAMEARDWAGFTAQLTPEAQEQFAGTMVMTVVMMKAMSEAFGGMAKDMADGMADAVGADAAGVQMPDVAESEPVKALDALLARHGIDEKSLSDHPQAMLAGDPGAGLAMLAAPIEDKAAFIVEAFEALEESNQDTSPPQVKGTLRDVVVDGDTATATLVKDDGEEPIEFRRIDGSWRMGLPLDH